MYIYTGVGSRNTPIKVLNLIQRIAHGFATHGWILRSGGACGADMSFEIGCDKANGPKEIYLPWRFFNNRHIDQNEEYIVTPEAIEAAKEFHPNWNACKDAVKRMHGRNVQQLLGYNLNTPSSCIICYTPDGRKVGGTAQAIRIAEAYNIPIFNIGNHNFIDDEKTIEKCREFLRTFVIK